jgi:hypothetical protein
MSLKVTGFDRSGLIDDMKVSLFVCLKDEKWDGDGGGSPSLGAISTFGLGVKFLVRFTACVLLKAMKLGA